MFISSELFITLKKSELFIATLDHAGLHVDVVPGAEVCPRFSVVVPFRTPPLAFEYMRRDFRGTDVSLSVWRSEEQVWSTRHRAHCPVGV